VEQRGSRLGSLCVAAHISFLALQSTCRHSSLLDLLFQTLLKSALSPISPLHTPCLWDGSCCFTPVRELKSIDFWRHTSENVQSALHFGLITLIEHFESSLLRHGRMQHPNWALQQTSCVVGLRFPSHAIEASLVVKHFINNFCCGTLSQQTI